MRVLSDKQGDRKRSDRETSKHRGTNKRKVRQTDREEKREIWLELV